MSYLSLLRECIKTKNMEKLIELGKKTLIGFGDFEISYNQTFILLSSIILLIVLSIVSSHYINKSVFVKSMNEKLRRIIIRSVSYTIWILGLVFILRFQNIDTQGFFSYVIFSGDKVTITIHKLFSLVVIIFIIRLVVLFLSYYLSRKIERDQLDSGKGHSLLQIMKYLIWIAGLVIGIGAMGVKITFFIASISALLVGVGFGLQHIFNDFFSGIIILFDGSIKLNDVVQVGDVVGEVKDIGMRTTRIRNRDNIILIIPNSKFTSDNIVNWSAHDQKTRFEVSIGVAYGSDVRLVEKVLLDCAIEVKYVELDPKPFVRFENFGNSSLDFRLFFWTQNSFFVENTKSEIRFKIDQKFREHNITIPFPQHDLHIIDGKI